MRTNLGQTDGRTDGRTDGQTEKFNTTSLRFTGDNNTLRPMWRAWEFEILTDKAILATNRLANLCTGLY